MAQKYIVSFDQGTTSCRALLIDTNANIVAVKQAEFTQIFPQSGWVEHNASEIWETQLGVFSELIKQNNISPDQILSIGITNQRETTVLWDKKTGEPLYNAIVWQDRRTIGICNQLKKDGYEEHVKSHTGLVIDAYFSGTKIKWILDNVDGARERANNGEICFGTIDTWLIWKMTNGKNHLTDFTNASRTMLFDIVNKKWDDHMLKALNIPASLLPTVQNSSSDFGKFKYENFEIPIGGVAGDQQAALFGQACFEKGMAKNTYGTGCFLLMNIGDEFASSRNGLLTTLACNDKGQACYALEGSVFIAGAGVQWLRDGLNVIAKASDTEEICVELKHENDVVVVPAFAGLGAPYWDMEARGAIFGITRGTTDKQIVKATVDAIAYQTKDIINAMQEDMNATMKELKVDGGAVANNYLMQFQSDILNVAVERPEVIETTAMGAAYLAGMHIGIWDSNTIQQNRKVDRKFSPTYTSEKINQLYGQWQMAIKRVMLK